MINKMKELIPPNITPDCCNEMKSDHILFGTFILQEKFLYLGFIKDQKPLGWGVKVGYNVDSFFNITE